jgi:hypothetical protein
MRIHTLTEWQLTADGMHKVRDEWHNYEGPVAHCGGGKGGGGGQRIPDEFKNLAGLQTQLGQAAFAESTPLRYDLLNAGRRAVRQASQPITGQSITSSPMYGAIKAATEAQFNRARNQAIGSTPAGGALASQLGNIQGQRATALTQAMGQLGQVEQQRRENAVQRALGTLTGQTGQASSLLSGAGSSYGGIAGIQAQQAQQASAQNAAKSQGMGQGLGAIASTGAMKFCWVAREVYGSTSIRWVLFRCWLLLQAPNWFRWTYGAYGPMIAKWLEKKPRIKAIIKVWMNKRL